MSPQWVNRQDTKKQGPSNQTLPRTPVEEISVDKCRPPVLAPAAFQAVPSPVAVSAQHIELWGSKPSGRAVSTGAVPRHSLHTAPGPTADLSQSLPASSSTHRLQPHSPTHLGDPKKDTLLSFSNHSSDRTACGLRPTDAQPPTSCCHQQWALSVPRPVPLVPKISLLPQLVMDLVKPGLLFLLKSVGKILCGRGSNIFPCLQLLLSAWLSLCNATWRPPLWPVPSATWLVLWCLYPGVPAAAKSAANILGISALESQLLCEAAALQLEICVCKGKLSNNNIGRGKKEEKGLYITELTELLQ